MPEEETQKGNRWTHHAVTLLADLNWEPKGDTNIDIPCTVHQSKRRHPHGIDAFLTYYDPYSNSHIGVVIETKNYAWRSIKKGDVQQWVNTLVEVLECTPYSEDFDKKLNFDHSVVQTGLLMIWVHDLFNKVEFDEYIKSLSIPKKQMPLKVYIVANDEILKLYSISDAIKRLNQEVGDQGTFNIYYPSRPKNDSYKGKNLVTLEYIKSKYIFGKMTKIKKIPGGGNYPHSVTVVLYFDNLDFESLEYMYLALRLFQLTDDEIRIIHYMDPSPYRSAIEEFKRKYTGENKTITFEPMLRISDVPWRHE